MGGHPLVTLSLGRHAAPAVVLVQNLIHTWSENADDFERRDQLPVHDTPMAALFHVEADYLTRTLYSPQHERPNG